MPGLMATIGANANPMRKEFTAVERMAARAGANIRKGIEGGVNGHSANSGAIRESLVLLREMSRGNWSRVPGSLSILLGQLNFLQYIVKDNAVAARILAQAMEQKAAKALADAMALKVQADASLTALASMRQASAGTILAVQADRQKAASAIAVAEAERVKAVAAGEAATAMEAESGAARFSIGPLGWVAIALIAVGTAAYFTFNHFKRLREEAKNLADLMDGTRLKFSEQADILKRAAEEAQSFDDWLKKLADSEEGLAEKTEEALKALREQAKMEKEIAESNGASKKKLAEMDIAAAQKELNLIVAAKLEAGRKLEQDQINARDAEKNAHDTDRAEKIQALGDHAKAAGRVVDAIMEKMKTQTFLETKTMPYGQGYATVNRPANSSDKINIEVNGKKFSMSLDEATKIFNDLTAEEQKLVQVQKEMADLLASKKKLTEKDLADYNKLSKESRELQADIALKEKYLPQITNGNTKAVHGSLTSNQQIGAYSAPAALLDVNKHQLHELKGIHSKIDKIGKIGGGGRSMGGVKY